MNIRLGEILIEQELITDWQVNTALTLQRDKNTEQRLGEILLELDWVKQHEIDIALDTQMKRKHLLFMFDQLPDGL